MITLWFFQRCSSVELTISSPRCHVVRRVGNRVVDKKRFDTLRLPDVYRNILDRGYRMKGGAS